MTLITDQTKLIILRLTQAHGALYTSKKCTTTRQAIRIHRPIASSTINEARLAYSQAIVIVTTKTWTFTPRWSDDTKLDGIIARGAG
jgi:hypothetical protein